MVSESSLAKRIRSNDFIITAEYLPGINTEITVDANTYSDRVTAVNAADNHYGIALSSLAASVALLQRGIEPVYQVITRDRNRIAIQADLLGAASLGVKNVLCLSGFHQTLIGCPKSANVFDIDSIQLIDIVKRMNGGELLEGQKIEGAFNLLIGATINPSLQPLELNIIRLRKKIAAGAAFIQTQAVFDVAAFKKWLDAARAAGLTEKAAILAGVLPLQSAAQAKELLDTHTDFVIPEAIIQRLADAGNDDAQRQEGIKVAAEIIRELRKLDGLRGIHLLSGGNESSVGALLTSAF
jgi:methylenetetrahydrofolate reductase (NADPH)